VHGDPGGTAQNLALFEYRIKTQNPVLAIINDQDIAVAVVGHMDNIALDLGPLDDGAHQLAA